MTVQDSRCEECDSKETWPFIGTIAGRRVCLCRRCAGLAAQPLLRYIKGFDRDHPRPKKPRDATKPIVDPHGVWRCRKCEVKLEDAGPFCSNCASPAPNGGNFP